MSWEENFKKVTKVFQRLLNERWLELKVMKIQKWKYFKNLKSRIALKEKEIFYIMHLIERKSWNLEFLL